MIRAKRNLYENSNSLNDKTVIKNKNVQKQCKFKLQNRFSISKIKNSITNKANVDEIILLMTYFFLYCYLKFNNELYFSNYSRK